MLRELTERSERDLTWYIKWISSAIVLMAIAIRSTGNHLLQYWDIILSFIGAIGWLYVGYQWNDRAVMLLNAIIAFILFIGIVNNL